MKLTTRQIAIAKVILAAFEALDGGQAQEVSIHADASLLFGAIIPKNEFTEVFEKLNAHGCFNGVPTKFHGIKWSLSDVGEQTRLEMR